MDTKSFKGKFAYYPASGEGNYHTLPASDYLLTRVVLAVLKNENIKKVRLLKFSGKCEMVGAFLPHAHCNGYIQIEVNALTETKKYDSSLKNFDIGNVLSPYHFGYADTDFRGIGDQMKLFINTLTRKLRIQL